MHFLDFYSVSSGLKVDRPSIVEKFYPTGDKKYIILHPFTKPAKSYSFWGEVTAILSPILEKQNISIIRIGAKNEPPLSDCINHNGNTTINQVAYLIKNSELVLGADSFSTHLAGHYDKKLVALYSSSPIQTCKPYWGNPANQRLLDSGRGDKKWSYSFNESPKTIDTIPPETIVQNVCELLNLEFKPQFKTIHFGDSYKNPKVQVFIPSQVYHVENSIPEIRMDLLFNEDVLAKQLSVSRCYVVTNRPIKEELLQHFAPNIAAIVYLIDENGKPEFIKKCVKLGIQVSLYSDQSEEWIQEQKLTYYELGLIQKEKEPTPEIVQKLKATPNLYYKSQKFMISGNNKYAGRAAFYKNLPNEDYGFQPVIDSELFWKDAETCYFAQKLD